MSGTSLAVLDRDCLEGVGGGESKLGKLWKEWGPDIVGTVGPGLAGGAAGYGCFAATSLALGGAALVPPAAPFIAAAAPHIASIACSSAVGLGVHRLLRKHGPK